MQSVRALLKGRRKVSLGAAWWVLSPKSLWTTSSVRTYTSRHARVLAKDGKERVRANEGNWINTTLSNDKDINTSATIIPSIEIVRYITRSRAQQLNHQVNSFLCSSTYNIKSRLLPNDLIIFRNQGEDHGEQTEHQEGAGEPRRRAREGGEPIQFGIAEFESNSEFRTTSYSNWRPDCIRPPFWTFYICTES
jgi:hypothetical protein